MSNVTLSIGGRPFIVASADGEEAHIEMLGRMVDERARKIATGQNEVRTLLFAALMMADELHEAHRNAPPPPPLPTASPPPVAAEPDPKVVARVHALAQRIEKLAEDLEQRAENP